MQDNITDWALEQYQKIYSDNTITKEDIFFYTYGLLHSRGYRDKYQASLVRGIPHIPMAPDFWAFSKAGRELSDLHLNYEICKRYALGKPLNPIPDNPRSIKFGPKPNTGPGPKTIDDPTTLIVNGVKIFDNLPVCEYKVNGRTPVGWLTWIPKKPKSGIVRDPFRHMTGKEFHAVIERLVYVGVESDRVISELPDEFEGMDPLEQDNEKALQALGQQTLDVDGEIQTRLG